MPPQGRVAFARGASSSIRQPAPPATVPVLPPPSYAPHPISQYPTHVHKHTDLATPYPYYIAPQHVNQGSYDNGPVCYPAFYTRIPAQVVYTQTRNSFSVCHNQRVIVLLLTLPL